MSLVPKRVRRARRARPRRAGLSGQFGRNPSRGSTSPFGGSLTTCVLRAGQIVPDRLTVPMKYATTFNINLVATIPISHVFSQNSVFDPDVTGGGGLAQGFTSLSRLYQDFRVLSSSVRILALVFNQSPVVMALAPSTTNVGISAVTTEVASYRFAKPDAMKWSQFACPPVVLSDRVDTSSMAGTELYDSPAYFGQGSADPPSQFFWVFSATAPLGGAVLEYSIEIEYMTEWTSPLSLPP